MSKILVCFSLLLLMVYAIPAAAVTLGISKDGKYFTIDGAPKYLNGISYYAGCSVSDPSWVTQDLDDMAAAGLNWIRIWTHWDAGGNFCVTTPTGEVREPQMSRLKTIISECNKRGMIVDVTMHRGKSPVPSNQVEHLACARTLATELLPYRNAYIDIGNERDVHDARYVSFEDMGELISTIKAIDPKRLCTASGVPGDQDSLNKYLSIGHCDFICPHLCREKECPAQTKDTVKSFIDWMSKLGKRVPIHLQEPFRRDYASYQPTQDDFYRDDSGGKIADAAGWCFHNGSARGKSLFRSFKMTDECGRLFAQLDAVEKDMLKNIDDVIGGTDPNVRRYQAEYPEHLSHEVGKRDGNAWAVDTAQDKAGYLSSGPNISGLPKGNYRVTWKLMVDNNTVDNDPVVTLDICSNGKVIKKIAITRKKFKSANQWQLFNLNFSCTDQQDLEFRTYWHGNSNVKLDHVTLKMGNPAAKAVPKKSK